MSLILHYDQYSGKLIRCYIFDNNKSNLVHTHGLSTLELLLYNHKEYKGTPFEHLPKGYKLFDGAMQSLVYNLVKSHLEDEVEK